MTRSEICSQTPAQSHIKMTKDVKLALYVVAAAHPRKLGKTSFHIYNVIFPISPWGSKFHPS